MAIQIYLVERSDKSWALVAANSGLDAVNTLDWPLEHCNVTPKRMVSGVVIERFQESGIAKSYTAEFLEEDY